MGIAEGKYEASRVIRIGGTTYQPGDPIDMSGLPDHKVGQFLNQRIIRPVSMAGPDTTQT